MESEQNERRQAIRKRQTLYLVIGGTLSLLLPLLGVLYLKLSEPGGPLGNVAPDSIFSKREGAAARVQPAGAPAAPVAPPAAGQPPSVSAIPKPAQADPGRQNSGLSMVLGGGDYYQEPKAAAPAPPPQPKPTSLSPSPPAVGIPAPAQPRTQAPSFTPAKLKPVSGFGQFKSGLSAGPSAGTANSPPDVGALMNSMKGAGTGSAKAPAVPDINALLKSLPQGSSNPNPQ